MAPTARLSGLAIVLLLSVLAAARAEQGRQGHREAGTGCVLVVVSDSVTGKPVGYANIAAISVRGGCIADSVGRCVVCALHEGPVVLTTRVASYSPRRDTVVIARNRTDTLRVALRRQVLKAGETLDISPRHVGVPTKRKP